MPAPDLSIVIPTRPARLAKLRPLLASIAATPTSALERCELLLVVDDEDQAPIQAAAQILPPPLRFRGFHGPHRGLAPAKNTGVNQAQGRWLLFLDDDLLLGSDSIPAHLQAIDAARREPGRPQAFVGAVDWPEWLLRTRWDDLLANSPMLFFQSAMRRGEDYNFRHFIGGHTSVPAELVRAAGGFNPRFGGLMHEDIELGWRLEQRFGLRVRRSDARGWHDHPLTVRQYFEREHRAGVAALRASEINPAFHAVVWGKLGEPQATLSALLRIFGLAARQTRELLEKLEAAPLNPCADPLARQAAYLAHLPLKRIMFCAGAGGEAFDDIWSQQVGAWSARCREVSENQSKASAYSPPVALAAAANGYNS